MNQQKIIVNINQTQQNHPHGIKIQNKIAASSEDEKVSHLFISNKINYKKSEGESGTQSCVSQNGKTIRLFHRKQVNYKIIDVQSLQFTHRPLKKPLEDIRIRILIQKIQKIYVRKAIQLLLTSFQSNLTRKYTKQTSKNRFQRSKLSYMDPYFLKRIAVLAFPNLSHRIIDHKAYALAKLQLLYQVHPISSYQITIILLLIRMQTRLRTANLRSSFEAMRNRS